MLPGEAYCINVGVQQIHPSCLFDVSGPVHMSVAMLNLAILNTAHPFRLDFLIPFDNKAQSEIITGGA